MKQFLRFFSAPEVNNTLLKDILSTRFPAYDVYVKNGATYVRKNAIVKAKVKIQEQEIESAITVNTVQPWWVWLLIGWLIYAFYKRGFTDEVYSALRKDLATKFPAKFAHLLSPAEVANWKIKAKPLGTIGLFIFLCSIINPLYDYILPFILQSFFEDTWNYDYFNFGMKFLHYIPLAILWFILGLTFTKLPNIGRGRFAGYALQILGGLSLINFGFTFMTNSSILNLYYQIVGILIPTIIISSGIIIKNTMHTGASRYFCIVMIFAGCITFLHNIFTKEVMSFVYNGTEPWSPRVIYLYIWNAIFIISNIILDFFLARSLYKMRKYPIERLSKSESTTIGNSLV